MSAGAAALVPAASAGPSSAAGAACDYDPDPALHLGLAHHIAREEWARCPALGCTQEDFAQEAVVALCDAATRYEPAEGRFPTFAAKTIAGQLRSLRARSWRLVKFGAPRTAAKLRGAMRHWRWDRAITPEAVAAELGRPVTLTEEQAHRAVGFVAGRDVFIADLASPDDFDPDEALPADDLADGMGGAEAAFDGLVGEAWAAVVAAFRRDVLARGHALEAAVLGRRLLADEDEQTTLAEIGRSFELSRERVRQVEERLLTELRHRAQRAGLSPRGERWGSTSWSREAMARRAQSNGTMTDTSLSPPASSGPWADAAHEMLRAVLRGGHHTEARRALRRARLCTDAEADRSVLVIAPDYAAVQGLTGAGAVALPGVRTQGLLLESGEVMLFAVPRDHLAPAMAPRWRRDVAAVERAYAAAGPRGEETGVLLTRVRSVVVTAPTGGPR